MTQVWHPHSTVACICEHQNKFLMVKENIHGKMVYNQPAGHIEDNESIIEATQRETAEETAIQVSVQALIGFYRYRVSAQLTFLRFALACDYIKDLKTTIDPDIDSVHWLSYDQILSLKDQLRSPLVLQNIKDYKLNKRYPLSILDE